MKHNDDSKLVASHPEEGDDKEDRSDLVQTGLGNLPYFAASARLRGIFGRQTTLRSHPVMVSAREIDHLELVAPRFRQAGLRDWEIVERLLREWQIARDSAREFLGLFVSGEQIGPEEVRRAAAKLRGVFGDFN